MTDQERSQVLKMIAEGKITPQEGLRLLQTLEEAHAEDEIQAIEMETGKKSRPEAQAEWSTMDVDSRIAGVKSTVRRLWQIPLWIGISLTVLSVAGMYWIMQGPGTNFWLYCLTLPLLLGVGIIAAAVGSQKARWIFVDVQQKPGDRPQRIFFGFPLSLKLTAWFLRNFGHYIRSLEKTNIDEVIQVVESGFSSDEPLIVNVDEGDEGERVRVFIG